MSDVNGNLRKGVGVLGNGSGLDGDSETTGTVGVESDDPGVVGSSRAGNELRGLAVVHNVQSSRNPLELSLGSRVGQNKAVVGSSNEILAVSSHKVVIVSIESRGGIVRSEGGHGNQSGVLNSQKRLRPGSHIVLRLGKEMNVGGGLVHLSENGSGSQSNGLEEHIKSGKE